MRRPIFWYLIVALIFAGLAKPALEILPVEMEKFRFPPGGLLPMPMLMLKGAGGVFVCVSVGLFFLFCVSCFRRELDSALVVKIVSFLCLIVLSWYGLMAMVALLATLGA